MSYTVAASAIACLVSASAVLLASGDPEDFEEECREAVLDEDVPKEQVADEVADCIARNLAASEDAESEGGEFGRGIMLETE